MPYLKGLFGMRQSTSWELYVKRETKSCVRVPASLWSGCKVFLLEHTYCRLVGIIVYISMVSRLQYDVLRIGLNLDFHISKPVVQYRVGRSIVDYFLQARRHCCWGL
jgi:hypothetical protein